MDIMMEEGVQGTTKEIGGKTDSDRVAQKMAPGNGNVREVQLLTTWKGTTPEPKNKGRDTDAAEERLSRETADPEIRSSQETASRTRGKEPPARRGAGSSRRPRARGAGHRRPPAQAGARVGMELPPQGAAKGLTPGFLPLHLGWAPTPKGKGGERSRGREGERLAAKEAKQQPLPRAASVCAGGGGSLRSCSPFGGGTVQGE